VTNLQSSRHAIGQEVLKQVLQHIEVLVVEFNQAELCEQGQPQQGVFITVSMEDKVEGKLDRGFTC